MKFIKVTNLMTNFGNADYKGLNIDLFISGSQVYSKDMSVFIGATTEENSPTHDDLTEITEADYVNLKKAMNEEISASDPIAAFEDLKVKNTALQTDLANTKLAMAELAEQQQADKLNNQLALAEVIESIMGGGITV